MFWQGCCAKVTDHVLGGFHCTALHCRIGGAEGKKKLNLLVFLRNFLATIIIFVNSWDLFCISGNFSVFIRISGKYQKYLEIPPNSCEFCSKSRNYLEFMVIYVNSCEFQTSLEFFGILGNLSVF